MDRYKYVSPEDGFAFAIETSDFTALSSSGYANSRQRIGFAFAIETS